MISGLSFQRYIYKTAKYFSSSVAYNSIAYKTKRETRCAEFLRVAVNINNVQAIGLIE